MNARLRMGALIVFVAGLVLGFQNFTSPIDLGCGVHVSSEQVSFRGSVVVTWTSTGAIGAQMHWVENGSTSNVHLSGTLQTPPLLADSEFRVDVFGADGAVRTCRASVKVSPPPQPIVLDGGNVRATGAIDATFKGSTLLQADVDPAQPDNYWLSYDAVADKFHAGPRLQKAMAIIARQPAGQEVNAIAWNLNEAINPKERATYQKGLRLVFKFLRASAGSAFIDLAVTGSSDPEVRRLQEQLAAELPNCRVL